MSIHQLDALVEATIGHFQFDRPNRKMRIDLLCAQESKLRKTLIASGVDDFLIDDMKLYNIIDRVNLFEVVDSLEEVSECASRLFFLLRKQELTSSDMNWPTLLEKLRMIQSGTLRLMEIEPVYGASIIVLAESFSLAPTVD